jgi:hypothetical protein
MSKARVSVGPAAHSSQEERAILAARLKDASTRLHDALVNGQDTAGIRRELQEINEAEVWIAVEISEREAAQRQAEAELVISAARVISTQAIARVGSNLADLLPPAPPAFAIGDA